MVGAPNEFDTVLDVCQHKHRRIVLAALEDQHQSVPITDLETAIVKHNHHTAVADVDDETATRILTGLHHVHLPKLAEAELIEYDRERQLVEPTAQFTRGVPSLSAILDADPGLETPLTV